MARHSEVSEVVAAAVATVAPGASVVVSEEGEDFLLIRIDGLVAEVPAPAEPDAPLMQRAVRVALARFGPGLVVNARQSGRHVTTMSLVRKTALDLIRRNEVC